MGTAVWADDVGPARQDVLVPRSAMPLVGRSTEFADLAGVLTAASAGNATALVLGGDAGVGKTRLLAEFVARASAEGFRTLIGHCVDLGDTPPPYLPFAEAFTRLAGDEPALGDELVRRHAALARLLPAGGAPADRDEPVDRGELFDAVLGALAFLAGEQPVVLAVEDVHWADRATRDLLGYLFTRLASQRLALVVSFRSDDLHRRHPLRSTLAEWTRLPAVSRLTVDPLGADDVRELVRALEGGIGDDELETVVSRADGNAFFAEELVTALRSAGPQQLPWQLADLLLVRLDRLSDEARQIVRIAAVAGRRVSHAMLSAVAELPAHQLDTALREAIDSNVLHLTTSGRGYVFRHALLAEAVYDDLLPGERTRLHDAYARVLAADPGHRPAELARHALASHDLVTAFSASVAAGAAAMALAAPQEAMQHYETALELHPRLDADAGDTAGSTAGDTVGSTAGDTAGTTAGEALTIGRPALILAAAEASDAAGYTQRGMRMADRALAELPDDAPAIDRATILFAAVRVALGHEIGDRELDRTAEAVRLTADDGPTELRARILALHGRVTLGLGRDADAEQHLRDAAELGELVGSRQAATEARIALAVLERRRGDPVDAARALEAAADQAGAAGDHGAQVRSLFSLGSLWFELCELDRAAEAFDRAHARAVASGRMWELFGAHSRAMIATLQFVRGEWDAALGTLDTTGQQPTTVAEGILRSTAVSLRGARGDSTILADVDDLRPLWEREGRIGLYAVQGALELFEQRADVEAALTIMDEIVEVLGRVWLSPWFPARIHLSTMGIAVLAAAAETQPRARHAELAAAGERLLADGRATGDNATSETRRMGREGVAWLARLEAEAARLRWLTGQDAPTPDELVGLWRTTVDEFGYGHAYQLAVARVRLAEALRAVGDTAGATEALDAARPAAEAMRAGPLLERIRATAGRRVAPEGRGLSALTDRESSVLAELVEGRTNRQIAAKLFISDKTVSVHVSNILAKLGVSSRAEAAALARRA